uniref:Uncharacterized protein n=1 Tax=Parastrongyloides trichosuri TaxID=131310 RepID=A0A0N4ZDM0_PARTI
MAHTRPRRTTKKSSTSKRKSSKSKTGSSSNTTTNVKPNKELIKAIKDENNACKEEIKCDLDKLEEKSYMLIEKTTDETTKTLTDHLSEEFPEMNYAVSFNSSQDSSLNIETENLNDTIDIFKSLRDKVHNGNASPKSCHHYQELREIIFG